jgi:recombinational DNA repair ATPase RecF
VYGSNGSGKSSVFWALYTLLQSSIKEDADIQKYFKDFEESDTGTHQTLKNVFVDPAEDAYIKITTLDTETGHEQVHTISHDTINTNEDTDTLIQELNLASDFINYKLLHNFYRGSHKQEVNLWPVFERDIFPFLTEGTQNWLSDIIMPLTQDVPRTPGGKVVSQNRKANYENQLDELNNRITQLLSEIETNANAFLKDHFFEGRDFIRIKLSFQKKFNFNLVKQKIWREMASYHRKEHLKIGLQAELYEAGRWITIRRIQSFLNEAQLTRIAIAIRIGALRTRVQSTQYKILVLDDMLISLDMSNRMDVVRIILNKENKSVISVFRRVSERSYLPMTRPFSI